MAGVSPARDRAPGFYLPGLVFCVALVLSFTIQAGAQSRTEVILAQIRQIRTLVLSRHVDSPPAAVVDAGALRGVREAAPGLKLPAGDWEAAFRSLAQSQPDRAGVAGERAVFRMVEAVGDPYTAVLDRNDMADDREGRERGSFTGIGVELAWDDGLVVVACLDGSPAAASGLRPGDRLRSIDGTKVAGLSFYRAGDLLVGPEGSQARLEVERGRGVFRLDVPRRRLRLPGLETKIVEPGVGLLRIGYFGPKTASQAAAALTALRARGAERLVLDLRRNPGGDFQQGVGTAALFRQGDLLRVETREGVERLRSAAAPAWKGRTAVLVDGGTASAAEIVAQALQGTPGIRIVGQKTFGKAAIGTLFPLPGGFGLRMTTGRYQSRTGASLSGVGLTPDVTVPPGRDALKAALAALRGQAGRKGRRRPPLARRAVVRLGRRAGRLRPWRPGPPLRSGRWRR